MLRKLTHRVDKVRTVRKLVKMPLSATKNQSLSHSKIRTVLFPPDFIQNFKLFLNVKCAGKGRGSGTSIAYFVLKWGIREFLGVLT